MKRNPLNLRYFCFAYFDHPAVEFLRRLSRFDYCSYHGYFLGRSSSFIADNANKLFGLVVNFFYFHWDCTLMITKLKANYYQNEHVIVLLLVLSYYHLRDRHSGNFDQVDFSCFLFGGFTVGCGNFYPGL